MKLKRTPLSDEIPTSSMADIAFLLIVYFMVTATFAATRGLDFALPRDEDTPPVIEKEESVLIEIKTDGSLVIDQKPMQKEDIFEYLKPKLVNNPKKPVIIKPDPSAPYGQMVATFDALRQIKIQVRGEGEAREVKVEQITLKRIQEAEETGEDLGKDVNVSIPTQREIERFWF